MKGGLLWFMYEPAIQNYQVQPDAGLIWEVRMATIFINSSATAGTREIDLELAPINSSYPVIILACKETTVSVQKVAAGPPFTEAGGATNWPYPIRLHSEDQLIVNTSKLIAGDTFGFFIDIIVEGE